MDQGIRALCQAETKRLLLFLGITFAIVILFQYSEILYRGIFSSIIYSASKIASFSTEVQDLSEKKIGESNVSTSEHSAFAPGPQKAKAAAVPSSGVYVEEGNGISPANSDNGEASRVAPCPYELNPALSLSIRAIPTDKETDLKNLRKSVIPPTMSVDGDTTYMAHKDKDPGSLHSNHAISSKSKPEAIPESKKKSWKPPTTVVSISQMSKLLEESHASSQMAPKWSSMVDQEMLHAKSLIENAPIIKDDSRLYSPLYRNVSLFKRSYDLMESMLKIYIYREGKKPMFHQPLLDGIYASEGWFMKLLQESKKFVTADPRKAHLFYIAFSSRLLELTLYVRHSHSRNNLIQYMKDYVDMIAGNYPHWNRTGGSDHFLAACHDWAPAETRGRMLSCIRALCNADIEVGFKIGKDVSLPQTYVSSANNPLKDLGQSNPPSQRPVLAFFAGNLHGYVRPILLDHWENKDSDMKISGPLLHDRGNRNYKHYMMTSKYCICARGHEVNSPRIVEAIFHECIPVIISDNFVPPFFEVLDWESFSVFVLEKDIPNLKNILLSISKNRYIEMHKRVKKVQQHFLWHAEPVKYDLFHMILHSVWFNRIFQIRPA